MQRVHIISLELMQRTPLIASVEIFSFILESAVCLFPIIIIYRQDYLEEKVKLSYKKEQHKVILLQWVYFLLE